MVKNVHPDFEPFAQMQRFVGIWFMAGGGLLTLTTVLQGEASNSDFWLMLAASVSTVLLGFVMHRIGGLYLSGKIKFGFADSRRLGGRINQLYGVLLMIAPLPVLVVGELTGNISLPPVTTATGFAEHFAIVGVLGAIGWVLFNVGATTVSDD